MVRVRDSESERRPEQSYLRMRGGRERVSRCRIYVRRSKRWGGGCGAEEVGGGKGGATGVWRVTQRQVDRSAPEEVALHVVVPHEAAGVARVLAHVRRESELHEVVPGVAAYVPRDVHEGRFDAEVLLVDAPVHPAEVRDVLVGLDGEAAEHGHGEAVERDLTVPVEVGVVDAGNDAARVDANRPVLCGVRASSGRLDHARVEAVRTVAPLDIALVFVDVIEELVVLGLGLFVAEDSFNRELKKTVCGVIRIETASGHFPSVGRAGAAAEGRGATVA